MKKLIYASALLLSTTSFASNPNITIDGTVPAQITEYNSAPTANNSKQSGPLTTHKKDISYLHVYLSPQAKAYLTNAATDYTKHPFKCSRDDQKQLGMGIVPVFDQGGHGSCVTFAVTAAIDAVYGAGDYISQFCNLELGTYLHQQNASYPSGWDGSYNDTVFNQIKTYGVISMASQIVYGCSGKYVYPKDAYTSIPLPAEEFKSRSVDILANMSVINLLTINDAFDPAISRDKLLANVKDSLKAGNRVVIATLLDRHAPDGGIQGQHSILRKDSWILTPEILKDIRIGKIDSAHDMVITGYDDQAVINGPNNTKHVGAFTLRNSWGIRAGDFGSYYMSYDYFKTMVFEAVVVK